MAREWIRQLCLTMVDSVNTMKITRDYTKVRIAELLRRYLEKLDPLSTKIVIQVSLTTKENIKPIF